MPMIAVMTADPNLPAPTTVLSTAPPYGPDLDQQGLYAPPRATVVKLGELFGVEETGSYTPSAADPQALINLRWAEPPQRLTGVRYA